MVLFSAIANCYRTHYGCWIYKTQFLWQDSGSYFNCQVKIPSTAAGVNILANVFFMLKARTKRVT